MRQANNKLGLTDTVKTLEQPSNAFENELPMLGLITGYVNDRHDQILLICRGMPYEIAGASWQCMAFMRLRERCTEID